MNDYFDFEQSIEDIDRKISSFENEENKELVVIEDYKKKKTELFKEIYTKLTPWQKVQIARHPKRPHSSDYINLICDYWLELHGDRIGSGNLVGHRPAW